MAFVIAQKPELKTIVKVVQRGDFGKSVETDFEMTFKKLSVDQLKPIREISSGDAEKAFSDEVFEKIKQNITGFDGIYVNEEKTEKLPFSDETLDQLMNITEVKRAVYFAFWDVQNGAVEKN